MNDAQFCLMPLLFPFLLKNLLSGIYTLAFQCEHGSDIEYRPSAQTRPSAPS